MYAGSDTKKTKQAAGIIVDAADNAISSESTMTMTFCPTWVFDARPCGETFNIGFQGDCPPDSAPYPSAPDVPFIFWSPVNNNVGQCLNLDTMTTESFDRTTQPASFLDIGSTPSDTIYYRFTPNHLLMNLGGSQTYGAVFDITGQGTECRIRSGDLRMDAGSLYVVLGNVDVTTGAVIVGEPPDNALSYGTNYSVNAEYGLFWGDVHAEDTGYLRLYGVIGRGRQKFGPEGSLIVSSEGNGMAPYRGSARLLIRTDNMGALYSLAASQNPYYGSLGNDHRFDADILTSGSIATSGTVSGNNLATNVSSIQTSAHTLDVSAGTDVSSGTFTITLHPAAAYAAYAASVDSTKRPFYAIVNWGSGTLTIDPDGSETIMQQLTLTVNAGDSVVIQPLQELGGFVTW